MLMQPKDVKTGANAFEVMVKGADGKPVSDRDVSVLFVMPAMPAMKMAEMRNEVKLKPSGTRPVRGIGGRDDGRHVERHGDRETGRERSRAKEADANREVNPGGRRATERSS